MPPWEEPREVTHAPAPAAPGSDRSLVRDDGCGPQCYDLGTEPVESRNLVEDFPGRAARVPLKPRLPRRRLRPRMLRPLPPDRWQEAAAAHLLNRAGFGGPPAEIRALAALGPKAAVDRLVDFDALPDPTPDPDWARPDPERAERLRAALRAAPEERQRIQREEQRRQRQRIEELRQWWLQRMVSGARPLQEKLALFWHGHFATSMVKVRDAYLMWRQNDLFRRLGAGSWPTLLLEASKDPAMMIWLDQAQSRARHPNENFAREVMELFALGEGHYSEDDIRDAARALTDWGYDRVNQRFVSRPRARDTGPKTVLGRRGDLRGDDVIAHIVAQPQSSRFICARLWEYFAGSTPSAALVDDLVTVFERGGRVFRPLLRALFGCEGFYSADVVRNQVKTPVQWLVSSVRMLERDLPPPAATANALRLLGQELFQPPSVKGWDGGLAWITTNNLLNRHHLAAFLVLGVNPLSSNAPGPAGNRPARLFPRRPGRPGQPVAPPLEVAALVNAEDRRDPARLVRSLESRLLQAPLRDHAREVIRAYLASQGALDDDDLRHAIRLIMCTPEFQLA